jgi:hypothetical protein
VMLDMPGGIVQEEWTVRRDALSKLHEPAFKSVSCCARTALASRPQTSPTLCRTNATNTRRPMSASEPDLGR